MIYRGLTDPVCVLLPRGSGREWQPAVQGAEITQPHHRGEWRPLKSDFPPKYF